jgi:exopolyphosphatase/guanosine-5'-triphosphate,3'-diphosphate pyrophosphatase
LKVGIIDLGSNTFNLLIAEIDDQGGYHPVYRSKVPVKLGEGSFEKNYITEDAMQRAMVALDAQIAAIKNQYCDRILAFATSAVRNASNGQLFVDKVKETFGITIRVIDGDQEASMIYNGVQLAGALSDEKSLIMDIGGGSTEFIIATDQEIIWKQSYDLGVSRIMEKFIPSDPLSGNQISDIEAHIMAEIGEVIEQCKKEGVSHLIGSSGSFDTISDVLRYRDGTYYDGVELSTLPYDFPKFKAHIHELIGSTLAERERMQGMVAMRIRMIVLSALFIRIILEKIPIRTATLSRYSLKEGVLFDVLKGNL